jgi:hypothetical protein
MEIAEILPQIYQEIVPKSLLRFRINETKATCQNCLRSRDARFQYLYDKNLKCCTFSPFLPNYAIGGILVENLKGAAVIKQQIADRQMTLPLGLFPTPEYQYEFTNKADTDFGTRKDLLCPYYDQEKNNCQIWTYRGVVCTTYFCTSSYGVSGKNYWSQFSNYLSFLEMALAEDNLVNLDFSPREISEQLIFLNMKSWTTAEKKQRCIDKNKYKKFWNGYTSEADFYIKCYNLVKTMNRKYFLELTGHQGAKLEKDMLQAGRKIENGRTNL